MPSTNERLSHSDEIILVRELQATDPNDRYYRYLLDKIVLANVGLVHKIVQKFPIKNATVTYDDLYQEGIAGLIHGIKKFDTKKGYRLSTYCYNWIQAMVRRYYANHARAVRLPVHVTDAQLQLNRQVEALTRELGRTPTMGEISAVNADASAILSDVRSGLSLNATIGGDAELNDLQGDDNADEFDIRIDVSIILSRLQQTISERDYDILLRRYGLNGYEEHTLNEIGRVHSLSRARVLQVQQKVLRTARELV